MNGTSNRYLLDTNIFIYYFNGEAAVQSIVGEVLAGQATGCYCPVSWAELLCYPALTEAEANQIRSFLRLFTSVPLSEQVLDRAAQVRRSRRIALPDALIAACAIESNSILITRNIRDFQNIADLSILNPFA